MIATFITSSVFGAIIIIATVALAVFLIAFAVNQIMEIQDRKEMRRVNKFLTEFPKNRGAELAAEKNNDVYDWEKDPESGLV